MKDIKEMLGFTGKNLRSLILKVTDFLEFWPGVGKEQWRIFKSELSRDSYVTEP